MPTESVERAKTPQKQADSDCALKSQAALVEKLVREIKQLKRSASQVACNEPMPKKIHEHSNGGEIDVLYGLMRQTTSTAAVTDQEKFFELKSFLNLQNQIGSLKKFTYDSKFSE